jgi:hypothetical protein
LFVNGLHASKHKNDTPIDEDYGYSTATHGDYVAVGNPNFHRYSNSSPTIYYTGSVDYFRYNKNTDQHDLIKTLFGITVYRQRRASFQKF